MKCQPSHLQPCQHFEYSPKSMLNRRYNWAGFTRAFSKKKVSTPCITALRSFSQHTRQAPPHTRHAFALLPPPGVSAAQSPTNVPASAQMSAQAPAPYAPQPQRRQQQHVSLPVPRRWSLTTVKSHKRETSPRRRAQREPRQRDHPREPRQREPRQREPRAPRRPHTTRGAVVF